MAWALLQWGGVTLLLIALSGLLAYMLTVGRFPPRLSKEGVELPPDEVEGTAEALEAVRDTLFRLVTRIDRLESHVGIEDAGRARE